MKYIFALIVLLNIPHKKLNVRLVSIKCALYTDSEDLPQITHFISYLYLISTARDNRQGIIKWINPMQWDGEKKI